MRILYLIEWKNPNKKIERTAEAGTKIETTSKIEIVCISIFDRVLCHLNKAEMYIFIRLIFSRS